MPIHLIGIDPGGTGGAAHFYSSEKKPELVIDLFRFEKHTRYQWVRWLEESGHPKVFIENVNPMPDDDPVTAWAFGRNVEKVYFALELAGIDDITLVAPATWQREFALAGNHTGNPNATREERYEAKKKVCWHYAEGLFPEIKVLKTMADSMLIAEYGRRLLCGELTNGKDGKGSDRVGRGVVRTSTWVER